MSSIFGFYYTMGLLNHMGWPRRRSLFNSEAVVNSLILDSAVEQMIDWAASIGACRPKLALQVIATMLRDTNWESKDAMNISAEVSNMKKQWAERGNSDNPREVVKPGVGPQLLTVTVRVPMVVPRPAGSVTRRARVWEPLPMVVVFQVKVTPG